MAQSSIGSGPFILFRDANTRFHATQMVEKARWAARPSRPSGAARGAGDRRGGGEGRSRQGAALCRSGRCDETGFGVAAHKVDQEPGLLDADCSSAIATRTSPDSGSMPKRKIVEIARPAGVVFALTPSTNPVATVFYKIMLCLLTRNAIIISPHPMAKACCSRRGAASCQGGGRCGRARRRDPGDRPSRRCRSSRPVMKSDRIDVILATGGVAGGARGLQFGQSGDRRRAGQCAGLCR